MGHDLVKKLRALAVELDWDPEKEWKRAASRLMIEAASEIERLQREVRGIPPGGFDHEGSLR